jgi:hypothetical protein
MLLSNFGLVWSKKKLGFFSINLDHPAATTSTILLVVAIETVTMLQHSKCQQASVKRYANNGIIAIIFTFFRKHDETISIRLKGNDVNVFLLDSFGKEVPVSDVDLELELPARFRSHSRLKSRMRQLIQRLKNLGYANKDGTKVDTGIKQDLFLTCIKN